jgi:alpha-amylase
LQNLCLYFQLHQPYRIRRFRLSDIGKSLSCFDDTRNESFFKRIASKCYFPAAALLLRLLQESDGKLKLSFSMSGSWISQCREYEPTLLELFQELAAHDDVEILCETSHHTLSSLVDSELFVSEISSHRKTIRDVFGKDPKVFRNTELIYSDEIGKIVANEGFSGCLLEGWEHIMESGFNANHVFHHPNYAHLRLLPRCYRRSDDIAFRFSNRSWNEWPLTGEKFQKWIELENQRSSTFIGLFMDFETIGEHQWRETGIFDFWEYWLRLAWKSPEIQFHTPSEAIAQIPSIAPLSVDRPLSWADSERDVSAWLGNQNQSMALSAAYGSKLRFMELLEPTALEAWRRMLTSDHFYYMSTKCSSDGEVHGYFSPFSEPFEAYLEYRSALSELEKRLEQK